MSLTFVLLSACKNNTEKKVQKDHPKATVEKNACTYSYNPNNTSLRWTAYKTTERIGVGGTFDDIRTTNDIRKAETPLHALERIQFSISTSSVNSGNKERDPKIIRYFFEKMLDTDSISGSINAFQSNDESGKVSVTLKINNVEKEVLFDYKLSGTKFSMKGNIDMNDFEATGAIKALNEVCYDLHKGKDGISKLWPDISIAFETELHKNCP